MKKNYRRAFIEITDACNLSCPFCAPGKRDGKFIGVKEFEAVALQARDLAEVVSLHVLGEPFMHPEFPKILCICSRLGLKVNLVTNGTLLDKFGTGVFNEPCLAQLSFSIRALAALPEDQRTEKLDRMISFAREKRKELMISFRLRGEAKDAFVEETRVRLLRAFGAEKAAALAISARPGIKSGGIRLADGVFLNFGGIFSWPGQDKGKRKLNCLGLRHHFAVLCSGEVVPCCADYGGALSLGNVKDMGLAEILGSAGAKAMRDSIAGQTAMPGFCSTCGFE